MNRSRTLIPVLLLTLAAMLTFGLTAALASDVVPSFELTAVAATNTCHAGHPQFHYLLNQNGYGSIEGFIGRDGVGAEGSYGWANFNGETNGPGSDSFGIPGVYPENTVFYFEVSTYSGENGTGDRTFYSKIYFNCTTGEQVGRVINQAYPDGIRRPTLTIVDGPAFEHPLDIRSVDISVNPQIDLLPAVQHIGRTNIGG